MKCMHDMHDMHVMNVTGVTWGLLRDHVGVTLASLWDDLGDDFGVILG